MTDEFKDNRELTNPNADTKEVSSKIAERRGFMHKVGVASAAVFTASVSAQGVSHSAKLGVKDPDKVPPSPDQNPVSTNEMLARYQRAQTLDQAASILRNVVLNASVAPHWIGDSDHFWYLRETRAGEEYRLVDAAKQTNIPAFDHGALAAALAKGSGEQVNPQDLPLSNVEIALSPPKVTFTAFKADWEYDVATRRVTKLDYPLSPQWRVSPDGKKAAFIRDYNLWVRDMQSGRERQLTHDGEEFYEFGYPPTVYGRRELDHQDFLWSPDSKRLVTQLRDTRAVGIGVPLVQHVPPDGSLRPNIINPERRVAFAGDEQVEAWQPVSIDVQSGAIQTFDCPPQPINHPPYLGYFSANRGGWIDNRYVWYTHQHIDETHTRVLKLDSHTGKSSVLFEEDPESCFPIIPRQTHRRAPAMYLPASRELIWWSDRNGWAHLYLYDALSGKLKKTLTQGNWLVRNILHYDADQRELFIQTAGRGSWPNPYYRDVCRLNLDTGELNTVVASDHEYVVYEPYSGPGRDTSGVSPSGRYVAVTRSRVDANPVSLLLDRDGRELLTVETADPYGMPDYNVPPEPALVKAADGETDVYAVVTRPSDFSPDKSYPLLDYTWGPPVGAYSNNRSSSVGMPAAAYAELGFIVVQVAGRANQWTYREKAFQDYSNPEVPGGGFGYKVDAVAAIKQLAQRYPYMDINRVGVVEPISTPGVLTAMLVYPDFYKVGTIQSPPADSRLFPMNLFAPDHPPYEDFAENLRGKLLLIQGMMDDVVSAGAMFRLVEALQKANKRFDMLVLPNVGHAPSDYVTRVCWDYLVRHLLGAEPPENFKLIGSVGVRTSGGA